MKGRGFRMKKSLCTTGFKDWTVEQIVGWMRPYGFDGIELWIGHIERYQEEHGPLDKLRSFLEDSGLQVAGICGYTTFSGGFSGERNLAEERITMRRMLDAARQLGCPLVRTFVGDRSSRFASPEQWGLAAAELRAMCLAADRYEVDIAAEIHYDTFVDDPDSALAMISAVHHPRFVLLFDGANLHYEKVDQISALERLYPHVRHVHLKNYRWDHDRRYDTQPAPAFSGDLDNGSLLLELKRRGYDGFVSLEYFGGHKLEHIAASLQRWKELCGTA